MAIYISLKMRFSLRNPYKNQKCPHFNALVSYKSYQFGKVIISFLKVETLRVTKNHVSLFPKIEPWNYPSSRAKRKKTKVSRLDTNSAEVGKNTAEHGNASTVRAMSLKYPGLKPQQLVTSIYLTWNWKKVRKLLI